MVLLAGGSSVAFGFNCQLIEQKLDIPVFNMGLHAGLGLSFILREIEDVAQSGDVVFLTVEHFLGLNGNYKIITKVSKALPKAKEYYKADIFRELKLLSENIRLKAKFILGIENNNEIVSQVYSRESFNAYGDVVGHHSLLNRQSLDGRRKFMQRTWKGVEMLNTFYDIMIKKGVKVYFMFPAYPITEYEKNKDVLLNYQSEINSNLKMPTINSIDDFVMPDSMFFDTVYHLDKQGQDLHSELLIKLIRDKGLSFASNSR